MARRRWIDPSFWDDLKIGRLRPIERLFFIGCFSNADDEGRLLGNPAYLRATIFKYDDMTIEEITEIRDNAVGMNDNLVLYSVDDEDYLAFRKWRKHQKPNYPKESQLPMPPFIDEEQSRSEGEPKSGRSRTDDMGRVGLGRVGLGSGRESPQPFSQIFTEETGVLIATGKQAEEIDAWMDDVSEDWFRAACKEAVDNNARKWSYVRAILERWKAEGRQSKREKGKRGSERVKHPEYAEALKERATKRRRETGAETG